MAGVTSFSSANTYLGGAEASSAETGVTSFSADSTASFFSFLGSGAGFSSYAGAAAGSLGGSAAFFGFSAGASSAVVSS